MCVCVCARTRENLIVQPPRDSPWIMLIKAANYINFEFYNSENSCEKKDLERLYVSQMIGIKETLLKQ